MERKTVTEQNKNYVGRISGTCACFREQSLFKCLFIQESSMKEKVGKVKAAKTCPNTVHHISVSLCLKMDPFLRV